jgi:superfamily II DNA or RNA helicase
VTLTAAHPAHPTLRDYQAEVVDSTWAHVADGARRGLIVMATGTGKTRTALGWWGTHRQRTLWLAHRVELIDQAAAAAADLFPEARITRATADTWDLSGDLVVGQVQTCSQPRRLEALRRSGEWAAVVVDESHHVHSPKPTSTGKPPKPVHCAYTEIVDALSGEPFVLGLTATPDRLDKRSVVEWFDDRIIANLDIRWAIEHGHLVPIRALTVKTELDLDSVKRSHGDFAAGDLGRAMSAAQVPTAVVDAWERHASDRITLAFAPTIESSRELVAAFVERGVAAAHLDGKTHDIERARLIRDLGTGTLRVLVNVGVTTEGTDIPAVSCVLLVRPTQSRGLAVQMMGRGLRLAPDKADCVAEGTLVLTDAGLVPIEAVTTSMRLWDGVEYVEHQGAVCRGEQTTIEYAGLVATPDHKVWTDDGWVEFGECARRGLSIRVSAEDGNAIRESDRRTRSSRRAPSFDSMRRLRRTQVATGRGGMGLRRMLSAKGRSALACPAVLIRKTTMRQPERSSLFGLRRQGHQVLVSRADGNGRVDLGESWSIPGLADRPNRQQRPLRTGQYSTGIERPEHGEQSQIQEIVRVRPVSPEPPGHSLRGRDAAAPAAQGDDGRRDRRQVSPQIKQAKRRVWDVLDSGPRHRFTANGLLVSNCLIIDMSGTSTKHDLVLASDVLGLHRTLGELENSLDAITEQAALALAAERDEAEQTEAEWSDPDEVMLGAHDPLKPRKVRHEWTSAPITGCLRRWTCSKATETVVVRSNPDGSRSWVAGVGQTVGDALIIATGERLGHVVAAAEAWIDGHRAPNAWRIDPATPKQIGLLVRLGHDRAQLAGLTKAQAGRLINAGRIAQARTTLERVRDANAFYRALDGLTSDLAVEVMASGPFITNHATADAVGQRLGITIMNDEQRAVLMHRLRMTLSNQRATA